MQVHVSGMGGDRNFLVVLKQKTFSLYFFSSNLKFYGEFGFIVLRSAFLTHPEHAYFKISHWQMHIDTNSWRPFVKDNTSTTCTHIQIHQENRYTNTIIPLIFSLSHSHKLWNPDSLSLNISSYFQELLAELLLCQWQATNPWHRYWW